MKKPRRSRARTTAQRQPREDSRQHDPIAPRERDRDPSVNQPMPRDASQSGEARNDVEEESHRPGGRGDMSR
jgi:hypothetical protein